MFSDAYSGDRVNVAEEDGWSVDEYLQTAKDAGFTSLVSSPVAKYSDKQQKLSTDEQTILSLTL
jgi:hypothetical protein